MRAIILAAGRSTRMGPLTASLPKCMLEYQGRKIISRILGNLSWVASSCTIVTGFQGNVVRDYIGQPQLYDASNMNIDYVSQEEQLGEVDALLRTPNTREPVLVLNSDVLIEPKALQIIATHPGYCIGVFHMIAAENVGIVATNGVKVSGIEEKSSCSFDVLICAGAYRLLPEVYTKWKGSTRTIPQELDSMVKAGVEVRYHAIRSWKHFTSPADLQSGYMLAIR